MATPPFSDELIEKLKGATAWRFNSRLGPVFTPRFFCCSDPNALGLSAAKRPVAVLSLSPNPCLPGDTVSFDGTDSYDPDGSVSSYAWTFEDGSPASSAAGSGTVSWAAAGEYEVTLVVTDGTGEKSSPARVIMVVTEPRNNYYLGASNGVWYTDDGGQNWASKNTGLAGDSLVVNDLKIDPATQHLAEANKTLWIATNGGIYVSNDGGDTWTQKNPASVANDWGDSPAPTVGDLEFQKLFFIGTGLLAMATWQNGGGSERSWIFYTLNIEDVRADPAATVTWGAME